MQNEQWTYNYYELQILQLFYKILLMICETGKVLGKKKEKKNQKNK